MSSWLPLSDCFYKLAYEYFLSPSQSQAFRLFSICKLFRSLRGNKEKYQKVLPFKEALENANKEGKLIGYVSKMIFVANKNIKDMTSTGKQNFSAKAMAARYDTNVTNGNFFAFTRIYSGRIKVGDKVYLLVTVMDKDDHEEKVKPIEFVVSKLYMWMGYHLDQVDEVPAGCICGLPDLGEYSIKYATLADSPDCPVLNKIKFENNLIKVSVKTKELSDMPQLNEGLRILKKIDPAIDTFYDECGDIILETSGEVHLERCLKDLEDDFAKVELEVSDPIMTFKETITAIKFRGMKNSKKEEIKKIKEDNKKHFREDNMKEALEKDDVEHREAKAAEDEEKDKERADLMEDGESQTGSKAVNDAKSGVSKNTKTEKELSENHSIHKSNVQDKGKGQKQGENETEEKLADKKSKGSEREKPDGKDVHTQKGSKKHLDAGDKSVQGGKNDMVSKSSKETKMNSAAKTDKNSKTTKNDQREENKATKDSGRSPIKKKDQKSTTMTEEKDEAENPKDKEYRWNTESSSFFETTSEDEPIDPHKIDEEWLYDDDRNTEKEDQGDIRYQFKESNFVYQKKRVEELKVVRKGANLKLANQGFIGLQRKKNHCEVLTQNKKYKVAIRAVALGQKSTDYLCSHKNKIHKLFSNGVNMKRHSDCVKFMKGFFTALEEDKHEAAFIKMVMRTLISFGPNKIGPNILLCKFAELSETLTAPALSNLEEYKEIFSKIKRTESYIKDRPDYEQYYAGINYEELIKSLHLGFDLALEKGPLCNEEMYGCVFIVEDFVNCDEENIMKKQLLAKITTKDDKPQKSKHIIAYENQMKVEADKEELDASNKDHQEIPKESVSLQGSQDNTQMKPSPAKNPESTMETPEDTSHDTNMIEVLKKEGMSCSKSRNSKSLYTEEHLVADPHGPMSTQMVSAIKKGCTDSFLGAESRLVQGLLLCTVFVAEETLGAVMDALSMRRADIVENEFEPLTNMFIVTAHIPIQESFGFFEKIMKLTSGKVSPQLEFYGWQTIDMDPFYQPKTADVSLL